MKDKEVGELWAVANMDPNPDLSGIDYVSDSICPAGYTHDWCYACAQQEREKAEKEIRALIIKLVEERAEHHNTSGYMQTGKSEPMHYCRLQALREFGIDPATWTKE